MQAQQLSFAQRFHIYFSTLLVAGGYLCVLGISARIKQPMAEQFQLSESFLGVLDGVSFLSGAFATLYLYLYPFKKPVLATVLISIVAILGNVILIIPQFIPQLAKPIFILSKVAIGLSMIQFITNMTVLTHYFHSESDQSKNQMWYALSALGDPFGIMSCEYFISMQKFSWQNALLLSLVIYSLSVIYLHLAVDEIPLEETKNQSSSKIAQVFEQLSQYYRSKDNILQSISSAVLNSTYFLLLLWLPYFFIKIGYGKYASLIAITYPMSFIVGTSFLQLLKKILPIGIGLILCILMSFVFGISLVLSFLDSDSENVLLFFILIFLTSLFASGYVSFMFTTDIKIRTRGNREFLMIGSINRVYSYLILLFAMIISGRWMEIDYRGFFKVNSILMGVCTLLAIARYALNPNSFEYKDRVVQDSVEIDEQF